MNKHYLLANFLRWSAFILVFSRGLMYIIFASPYRALLWEESLFSPVVKLFGFGWTEYANNSDSWISILEVIIGIFLIITSTFFLFVKKDSSKIFHHCIKASGLILLFHIYLHYLGHNHEFPIVPEYMVQGLTPWLFLSFLPYLPENKYNNWERPSTSVYFWTKAAVAMCFIGHGLYAFGIPYQPAGFVRLMSKTLFVEYETASALVKCVGLADIVLAILIYIKPVEKLSLGHIAYWGYATALSRVLAYVVIPGRLSNLNPWLLESSVRLIHGSLPLFLLLLLKWEIIDNKMPESKTIKNWFYKWQTSFALVFMFLFVLASLSAHGKLDFSDKRNVSEFRQERKENKKKIKKRNSRTSLNFMDFETSSKETLYSDDLFVSENFPVRIKLDCDSIEQFETIKELNDFTQNSSQIISLLESYIVEKFNKENDPKYSYTDKEILKFTEKVILTYDRGSVINASIYASWFPEHKSNIELNLSGQIFE